MVDVLGLISLIVGTAVGIIGIWFGYRTAKKSGAFRKPALDVFLMGQSLTRDPQFDRLTGEARDIDVIFGYSKDDKGCVLCSLRFAITNGGDSSAKNVHVRFAFPLVLRHGGFSPHLLEIMELRGPYSKSEVRRTSFTEEGLEYVDYVVPEIEPKGACAIEEMIDISGESSFPVRVDVVTKDGVPVRIDVQTMVTPRIRFRMSATDVEPVDGGFRVRWYQAENLKDLTDKIAEDETLVLRRKLSERGMAEKELSKLGQVAWAGEKAILVVPKLKKITIPEEKETLTKLVYREEPRDSMTWLMNREAKIVRLVYEGVPSAAGLRKLARS